MPTILTRSIDKAHGSAPVHEQKVFDVENPCPGIDTVGVLFGPLEHRHNVLEAEGRLLVLGIEPRVGLPRVKGRFGSM